MISALHGEFAKIYNNKNDKRLRSWLSQAEYQLRINGVDAMTRCMTPDDVVFGIITKVLTGKIPWDKERIPNISTFMFHQIRSYVANLKKKELNRQIVYRSYYECLPSPIKKKPFIVNAENKETPDLKGVSLEEVLKDQYFLDVYKIVKKKLKKDKIAYFVFEEVMKGYDSQSTARNLAISQVDVKRARNRIEKIIRSIRNSLKK